MLRKFLCLIRLDPRKVRLVVRIRACHQLRILPVGVGEGIFPRFCQLAIAPCEHLFAGRQVVVADMHHAAFFGVVIAAEKVIVRSSGKIARRGVSVLVIGNVARLIHRNAVENAVPRDRIGDARFQIVKVDILHILREEDLIFLMHGNCRVFPPQE